MSELADKRRRLRAEREALAELRKHRVLLRWNPAYTYESGTVCPAGFLTPIVTLAGAPGASSSDVDRFLKALQRLVGP